MVASSSGADRGKRRSDVPRVCRTDALALSQTVIDDPAHYRGRCGPVYREVAVRGYYDGEFVGVILEPEESLVEEI